MSAKRRGGIALVAVAAILAAGAVAILLYANGYARAAETAQAALDTAVRAEGMLLFGDADAEAGIILYPGGKVDGGAYANLACRIAERTGMLVAVPDMPLHLAVLDPDAADRVMAQCPDVTGWYIGGHSLGGAMAARYASRHADCVGGLILLAAYPADPVTVPTLSIYGACETVLDWEKYGQGRAYWSDGSQELVLPGGNHAQFGDYGAQKGDTEAAIPAAAQQQQAADAIARWLAELTEQEGEAG